METNPANSLSSRRHTYGIVGFGAIAKDHVRALTAIRCGSVIAAVDPVKCAPETESAIRKNHPEFKTFTESSAFYQNSSFDTVVICTPPYLHYSLAKEALDADKNVILEKPPVLSLSESKDLIMRAQQKNCSLIFSYHARETDAVYSMRSVLNEPGLSIESVRILYQEDVMQWHQDPKKWLFDPKLSGGGVLMDSGINGVSALLHALPQALKDVRVRKSRLYFAPNSLVETAARVDFILKNGKAAVLSLDWSNGDEKRVITIETNRGSFVHDVITASLFHNGARIFPALPQTDPPDMHFEQYTCFYKRYEGGLIEASEAADVRPLKFVIESYDSSIVTRHQHKSELQLLSS